MKDSKTYNLMERRYILAAFIEHLVHRGIDITPYMGKPLSYYNFEALEEYNAAYQAEDDNY